jgi:hypothetical protein
MDDLKAMLKFVQDFNSFISVIIVVDWRGGISEACHFEELIVVIGIA